MARFDFGPVKLGKGAFPVLGLAELLLTCLSLSLPGTPFRSGVYGRFNGEKSEVLEDDGGNEWVLMGDG